MFSSYFLKQLNNKHTDNKEDAGYMVWSLSVNQVVGK